MNDGKFEFMMFIIIQALCDSVKNYFNVSYREARSMIYNSKLYQALEDEKTKMWYYSNYDLFEMFLEEKEKGKYTVYEG